MSKTAIIFGAGGQDGSYLSELLLEKEYDIVGVSRRTSTNNTERISHLLDDPGFTLVEGDILDPSSINTIISSYKPDEVYNLAAQSFVAVSFQQPSFTFQVDTIGVINILESIRTISPKTKILQASTSEMFGNNFTEENPEFVPYTLPNNGYNPDGSKYKNTTVKFQDENTPFAPRSPYAIAKLASHHLIYTYREAYDLFASASIMFNHESSRRGEEFVTRKITKYIGSLVIGSHRELGSSRDQYYTINKDDEKFEPLRLGNLDAKRDWGHAIDFVKAMYLMLQQDKPDDYVICTGKTHSIREFLDVAFGYVGINDWSDYVLIDPEFYRPAEVDYLCGRANKAEEKLGWRPKITFEELVKGMVESDVEKYSVLPF